MSRSAPNEERLTKAELAERTNAKGSQAGVSQNSLRGLPSPDPSGVIQLQSGVSYQAGEINVVGPLVIQGDGRGRAKIVVTDGLGLLNLTATKVELSGLEIEWKQATGNQERPRALTKIRAQRVVLRDCRMVTMDLSQGSDSKARGIPAVAWKGIDPLPGGNQLLAENCELIGVGTGFFLDNQVARMSLKNVLKVSGGELCRLGDGTVGTFTDLHLEEVTCRQSGSLLSVSPAWINGRLKRSRPVTLTAKNCTFDLLAKTAGVLEFQGVNSPAKGWEGVFQIQGEDSLCTPPLQVAVWRSPQQSGVRALNGALVPLEGILETKFRFAGNALNVGRQSEVAQWDSVPRASHAPPGYRDLSRLERTATKGLQAN